MCLLQGGAQGDVQDNGADGGEQGVDQRHTAGDLGHDRDELRGLAKDVQVAEIADERSVNTLTSRPLKADAVTAATYLSLLPVGKVLRWMTLWDTAPQTRPMMNFRIKVVMA